MDCIPPTRVPLELRLDVLEQAPVLLVSKNVVEWEPDNVFVPELLLFLKHVHKGAFIRSLNSVSLSQIVLIVIEPNLVPDAHCMEEMGLVGNA